MRESLAKKRTTTREVLLVTPSPWLLSGDPRLYNLSKAFNDALDRSEQRALAADVKALMDSDASPEDAHFNIRNNQ